eukprot:25483-Rhodomonas_salina.3
MDMFELMNCWYGLPHIASACTTCSAFPSNTPPVVLCIQSATCGPDTGPAAPRWVNKSTITRLFREVNRHVKSDDEVHELDFIEFCELLYWMGRKAQRQTEGEEVTEGPLMWNRYGNLESILGVKIQRLHKFEVRCANLATLPTPQP